MNASTAASPPLPLRHCYWVVPGLLLAGEHPDGATRDKTKERLKKLLGAGIECFVDLTKPTELPRYDTLLPFYVEYTRRAIKDHGVPSSREQMVEILDYVGNAMRAGRPVYVHCRAGIGRTGTVVGCLLVEKGLAGDGALDELNRLWQQSKRSRTWALIPETETQAAYVRQWQPAFRGGGFDLSPTASAVASVGLISATGEVRAGALTDVRVRAANQATGAGQARVAVQNLAAGKGRHPAADLEREELASLQSTTDRVRRELSSLQSEVKWDTPDPAVSPAPLTSQEPLSPSESAVSADALLSLSGSTQDAGSQEGSHARTPAASPGLAPGPAPSRDPVPSQGPASSRGPVSSRRATPPTEESGPGDPLFTPDTLSAARALRERYVGTLLGLAVGDAVAAATQYRRPGTFTAVGDMIGGGPFDLPRGAWSDDTAMALCLAESLLETNGFDPRDQVQRYSRWQQEGYLSSTGHCVGITASTARSLAMAKWRRVVYPGSHDPEQLDPEPLSRIAPVALYYFVSLDTTLQQAADSSRTTCQAPAVQDACRLLGKALHAALSGQPKSRIFAEVGPVSTAGGSALATNTAAAALGAAMWAFGSTDNFRDAILRAANVGGNSDVVASVCGQLAGAHYGFSAIPISWRNSLMQKDLIEGYADRLLAHALVTLSN